MNRRATKFRVAGVQLSPVLFDQAGTTEKVLKVLEECGKQDVKLAVFPETCIPSYPYFAWVNPPAVIHNLFVRQHEQAVDVPGPVTEAVGNAAKHAGTVVVLGVNERDGGSLYNTQLLFDSDGSLLGKRRKIMPTFQERMIWGWGDGSGLRVFKTSVGRVGALICAEHFMPLARFALIAQREEIHCSHFPGGIGGKSMTRQIDAAIRHHAFESGAFVINSTAWLTDKQREEINPDKSMHKYLMGGNHTAIVGPYGSYIAEPLQEGEGMVVAEIDLKEIVRAKNLIDTIGHYARPDILRLSIDFSNQTVISDVVPEPQKTSRLTFISEAQNPLQWTDED